MHLMPIFKNRFIYLAGNSLMNNKKVDPNNSENRTLDKQKIDELRKKINSPEYINLAIEKIASDLTHLLFR